MFIFMTMTMTMMLILMRIMLSFNNKPVPNAPITDNVIIAFFITPTSEISFTPLSANPLVGSIGCDINNPNKYQQKLKFESPQICP
ncbi:hypothetical protein JCM19231_5753 [Vibrio ishigakensis]|uniref:Uncharacterized protein n=1 Tax=Vibrio ishigakensis TaxID=1481914 RepID=A0A0B8NZB8_9VIBR|nr:hypothetical protein JCM19231_5753 [Vibrio ishigakensis]